MSTIKVNGGKSDIRVFEELGNITAMDLDICQNQIDSSFKDFCKKLIDTNPYFPKMYQSIHNGKLFLGTLARIKRDNKWYVVPVIEARVLNGPGFDGNLDSAIFELYGYIIERAYKIIHTYKLNGTYEAIDPCQENEKDRISKHIMSNEYERI